ncbi:Y-family DNA polymerase [Acetatifactor aquisgranensis]|uniref:Y-family DNA polymerase n=1 Tax=Acetatifactor aquisgranensis TaxID=2941233 RepID=UPI002040F0C7|nr:DNA methylase [Acetatifactor aquisgranensis]MCI8541829.1 DNA methylase [Lachnospiraceae bacterium]
MAGENHIYIAIDLKSFYASVECVERGLDTLDTNLVVADSSRTEKTICLAVSPSMKEYGIPGRPRLFEVVRKIKEANAYRLGRAPGQVFSGSSCHASELLASPELAVDYITAPPRMALYMEYSTKIYDIYLRHMAPEDIHVYSIDEVFIDAAQYLEACHLTAAEFAERMIQEILRETGIVAAAGIGTNLYLCKVAMDIVAKHVEPNQDGVRIAELDEMEYRRLLWSHRPLTDFWRVGRGYARKLEENGLYTMGDIARCSLGGCSDYHNEELLYRLFGVGAELLIDHAWGYEPCTIADVKAYKPDGSSMGAGQVLQCPYDFEKAKLVVREMTDLLVLDLVDKGLVTNHMVLTIGYDVESLTNPEIRKAYKGPVTTDRYGRKVPKHAHGTANIGRWTSSTRLIMDGMMELYDRVVDRSLLVRRVTVTAGRVMKESEIVAEDSYEQLDIFTDYEALLRQREEEEAALKRERKMQEAILSIKKKFGKNAILKGMNLEEGATTVSRNGQIGGHKA